MNYELDIFILLSAWIITSILQPLVEEASNCNVCRELVEHCILSTCKAAHCILMDFHSFLLQDRNSCGFALGHFMARSTGAVHLPKQSF